MQRVRPRVEHLEDRLTPSTYQQSNIAYGPNPAQVLDVYSNTTYTNAPIVVLVHAGGWTSGSKSGLEQHFASYYLQQGFVVVAPNYRLVTPNGSGGYTNQFPVPVEDVASAVAWVQAHAAQYGADPGKVVLQGSSAGAQVAAMLAFDPTGFNNWGQPAPLQVAGFIGDSGAYDWSLVPRARRKVQEYLGSYYGPAQWDAAEASAHVSAGAPPSLIIDGTADTVTNYQNSTAFVNALQAAGDQVTYQLYPGFKHIEFSRHFAQDPAEQQVVTNYLHAIGL